MAFGKRGTGVGGNQSKQEKDPKIRGEGDT